MQSHISVADHTTFSITFGNGFGISGTNLFTFAGGTFPVVPAETMVSTISGTVPTANHAMFIRCRDDTPRRKGSGKTAYLDRSVALSSELLLCWRVTWDSKLIIKSARNANAKELSQFNQFTVSDTGISVVNAQAKTCYTCDEAMSTSDPDWTYERVSTTDILRYICKHITLAELDSTKVSLAGQLKKLRLQHEALTEEIRLIKSLDPNSDTSELEQLADDIMVVCRSVLHLIALQAAAEAQQSALRLAVAQFPPEISNKVRGTKTSFSELSIEAIKSRIAEIDPKLIDQKPED